jgi:hypothetical protein
MLDAPPVLSGIGFTGDICHLGLRSLASGVHYRRRASASPSAPCQTAARFLPDIKKATVACRRHNLVVPRQQNPTLWFANLCQPGGGLVQCVNFR